MPRLRDRTSPLLGLLLGLALMACGSGSEREPLRVLAASSLRDLMVDLGQELEQQTGLEVVVATGGSNLIADQVLAGASADLVLVASPVEARRLVEAGRLVGSEVLFSNSLVVIAPAGRSRPGATAAALLGDLGPGARVAVAHPQAVPAGRYARDWLQQAGLWEAVEPHLLQTLDARAALTAVATGAVELGVVYRTDAASTAAVEVVLEVPLQAVPIHYVGGVVAGSPRAEAAAGLLELCAGRTEAGRAALERHGFRPLEPHSSD